MSRRILKKLRNFRLMSGIIIALLTILSFQNCAPAPKGCADGSQNCTSDGSSSSASTSGSGSNMWGGGGSNNPNVAGGGGGSVNTGTTGSNVSSGGGGVSIGGGGSSGSGGTSGGGGTGGTGSGSTNNTFRILTQPMGIAVVRDAGIELKVEIAGGKAPYKYQWFKGGVAIAGQLGQYNFYSDTADSYSKEGNYYVEITDGSGNSLRSESAMVAISDEGTNCPAGSYYTFENAQYDAGTNYFTEYFDGPRGKFLLHQSFDKYGAVYGVAAKYPVRSTYTVSSDIAYRGSTYISCRTNIPRIHAPTKNPGFVSGTTSDQYADGFNYKYEGQVSFECRDRKLLFKADSCKWNYYKPATVR